MPKEWYDRREAGRIEDEEKRDLYVRIAAAKKPYFMRYIYPELMRDYNTYIRNADKNALREFGKTVEELRAMPGDERTEEQEEFLRWFDARMPVGMNDCVMNKICRRFEEEFDGFTAKASKSSVFDRGIMKTGTPYTKAQESAVTRKYKDYKELLRAFAAESARVRTDPEEAAMKKRAFFDEFVRACRTACTNGKALCDLMVDFGYGGKGTASFTWHICGGDILDNLLEANGGVLRFPSASPDGDYEFCGERYEMKEIQYKEDSDGDYSE